MLDRSDVDARSILAALVSGDQAAWSRWARQPTSDMIEAADRHGVLPMLAHLAEATDTACPAPIRAQLHARAATDVAADLIREHELIRLIEACHAADVPVLLMKGVDLAYSRYARPDLRPRTDSDLLVAPADRLRAGEVLISCGYERVAQSGGDLLMYQEPFRLRRDGSVVHVVDLHWRVFNPQRFAGVADFDDLAQAAEPRPALGRHARGLGIVHAVVLACVHRMAHHYNDDRLIWLVDLKHLASAMTPGDWAQLVTVAERQSVQAACANGLEAAATTLGAPVPAGVLAALRSGAEAEPSVRSYEARDVRHVARVLSDLRLLPGWRARARLVRQHLFPPAAYMRGAHAASTLRPLPLLYVNRIFRGARRWLTRS